MRKPGLTGRPQRLQDWLTSTDLAFLANRLQSSFIPISAAQALAGTSSAQTLQDSATLPLSSGRLDWSFKTKFTIPPSVTATPQKTAGSSSTGSLYVDSVVATGCVIKSSDSGDTRIVHLHAIQPSQGD